MKRPGANTVFAVLLALAGNSAFPHGNPAAERAVVNPRKITGNQKSDSLYTSATIECVIAAAQRRSVPANVLLGIASIEMGGNGDRLKNSNSSVDLGHFGINSIHFRPGEPLAEAGVRPEDVARNGCYNAEVAAWLLARHLQAKRGADFWVWAANYHSATPKHNATYRKKLIRFAGQWGRWLQYQYPQVSIHQPVPQLQGNSQ